MLKFVMDPAFGKLRAFCAKFRSVHYKKGETILRAGEIPQGLYFLERGYVRLYSLSSDAEELTLVVYKTGDFFPVVWSFFGTSPSAYYFEAMTPSVIYIVPREPFMEFVHGNSDMLLWITQHIITRFVIALRRMEYLVFGNASSRLASIILICGKEFGLQQKGEIELQVLLTHKDLANLVGVTRETVSIELKKFERQGLIGYNKKKLIVVKDPKGLEQRAVLL